MLFRSDLGESAFELDRALRRAFDLAATWRAVLLIDEADVFLEERSLHDLQRNAMVAVFLRQLEYYQLDFARGETVIWRSAMLRIDEELGSFQNGR